MYVSFLKILAQHCSHFTSFFYPVFFFEQLLLQNQGQIY